MVVSRIGLAMQSCTLNGFAITGDEVSMLAFDMGLGML
jgi:hypothetical protein